MEVFLFVFSASLMTFIFFDMNYNSSLFFNPNVEYYFYIIAVFVGLFFFIIQYFIVLFISKKIFQNNFIVLSFNKKEIPNYFFIALSEEIVYRYIIVNCFFILTGQNYFWVVFLTSLFFAINNFNFSKKGIIDLIFKFLLGLALGFFAFFINVYISIIIHVFYNLTFVVMGYFLNVKCNKKDKYAVY